MALFLEAVDSFIEALLMALFLEAVDSFIEALLHRGEVHAQVSELLRRELVAFLRWVHLVGAPAIPQFRAD